MSWFERLHANLWYRIEMTNAYIAYMQGDMVRSRQHEQNADRYEMALYSDSLRRRYIR